MNHHLYTGGAAHIRLVHVTLKRGLESRISYHFLVILLSLSFHLYLLSAIFLCHFQLNMSSLLPLPSEPIDQICDHLAFHDSTALH